MLAHRHVLASELQEAFAGCAFSHTIVILASDPMEPALRALEAVRDRQGALESLKQSATAGRDQEILLKVTRLAPSQAQEVCDVLAALPGVTRARVEHHLVRCGPLA